MMPTWFSYLSGFSLVILGVLQLVHRPRRQGATTVERIVNLGNFWSAICILVGIGLVLLALGYWQGPMGVGAPPPPKKMPRYH
jgi:hypothetical protein